MCGIAGILNFDGAPADCEMLRRCGTRMAHRGPDGEGVFVSGASGLVHRRLSIIDPSGGIQPMANEDGSVVVVFNGEIYNHAALRYNLEGRGHTFATHCDTEAIVHAYEEWGMTCPEHLSGMFAFTILDTRRRRLFLARDRLGIKPLNYSLTDKRFIFSSTLDSLAILGDSPREICPEAVGLFFRHGYIPAPLTIFRNVYKLLPGHCLEVSFDGEVIGPGCYWSPAFDPDPGPDEEEWLDRTEAALRESVRSHLMSDVPFGALLSGGVDSSIVAAVMAGEMSRPPCTFTIGFENAAFDERPFARRVAEHLGTEHFEEMIRADALSVLPEIVRHHGEPFGDSSAIPTHLLARMASTHVKMVLGGDGGDEVFAGYPWYTNVVRTFSGPVGTLRRNLGPIIGDKADPIRTWREAQSIFATPDLVQFLRPEFQPGRDDLKLVEADLCSQMQAQDLVDYLPNDILAKVDVATMASGLEARVPFLDHAFVELCGRIPSKFKLAKTSSGYTSKALLKSVGKRLLAVDIFDRPKQGFSVPLRDWFAPGCQTEIIERLNAPGLDRFLLPGAAQRLVDSASDPGQRLWLVLVFAEWLEQNPGVA